MTEFDAALVRRKLAAIRRNLDDLAAIRDLTVVEYRADRFRQKGTERLLQETVEAAVDVNMHVLRALGESPTDYFTSFVQLGLQGVIGEDLADLLAPAAGLRNRLVHEYEDLDDAIVLEAVGGAIDQFSRYVEQVERYLEADGV